MIDALRDCAPVHRCSDPAGCACPLASIGSCLGHRPELHRAELERLAAAITTLPETLVERLRARLKMLASQQRFEEAAELRQRAALLQRVLHRRVRSIALIDAGDLVLTIGGRAILIRSGRLCSASDVAPGAEREVVERLLAAPPAPPPASWLSSELHSETGVISSWLDRHAHDTRVLYAPRGWSLPTAAVPRGDLGPTRIRRS